MGAVCPSCGGWLFKGVSHKCRVGLDTTTYRVLKQYIEGEFPNGEKFCARMSPEGVEAAMILIAEKIIGKKVKTARMVFRRDDGT
jgi:hypothetical protein